MAKKIMSSLAILTALALLSKASDRVELAGFKADPEIQVKELQLRKAEEICLHHGRRCEQLRSIHSPQNKDLMEAELKLKLSEIDVEIARLLCE